MKSRPSRLDAASWILIAGQFGLAAAIATLGPTTLLPMHFDLHGDVDRWGDRNQMAGVVAGAAVLSVLIVAVRGFVMRRGSPEAGPGQRLSGFGMILVTSVVALLAAALTWDWGGHPGPRLGMVAIAGVSAFIGAVLGKSDQNLLMGVRTPWTFASRLAWDKANRLAGRLLFWGGVAGLLATPFAPQPEGFKAMTFWVLAVAAVSVFESWRVWRSDPERRA